MTVNYTASPISANLGYGVERTREVEMGSGRQGQSLARYNTEEHQRLKDVPLMWKPVQQYQQEHTPSDRPAHSEETYSKAFLVKIIEGKTYMRQLRDFLIEHPLLVVKLGFRLYLDPTQLHGIDVEKTVPKKRWFNAKLHTFNN